MTTYLVNFYMQLMHSGLGGDDNDQILEFLPNTLGNDSLTHQKTFLFYDTYWFYPILPPTKAKKRFFDDLSNAVSV